MENSSDHIVDNSPNPLRNIASTAEMANSDDAVDPEVLLENKLPNEEQAFHDFDPNFFSPLFLYRSQHDVVGSLIVHSSSEGAGRYDIGRKIGINTKTKSGNRRVSNSIQAVVKFFPQYIGQYQKMEGKYRTIKYFLKESKPERYTTMLAQFEQLCGRKCPFKFGEVLKFPNTKLNTLRISDITMRRMLYILQAVKEMRIILTNIKIVRYIQQKDAEEGYPFKIDKKSAAKCLLALSRNFLCRLFETEYEDEGVKRPLEVITSMDIESVENPEVQNAINVAAAEFIAQNKIFPLGTARPQKKHANANVEEVRERTADDIKREEKQKEAEHLEYLKDLLKTKHDLPIASEKTMSSLAVSYQRRRGMSAIAKAGRVSGGKRKAVDDVSAVESPAQGVAEKVPTLDVLNEQFACSSGAQRSLSGQGSSFGADDMPSTSSVAFLMANQDLARVMDSSALSNIKQEIVNALNGEPVADNSATNNAQTEVANETAVGAKRSRKRKKPTEAAETPASPKKKKRILDDIDVMSLNRKVYMRSRFTAREKDMLLLIRAVGFFLNPVHRFWLDPTVMRDIMHEYVPESRCKTANSLLAAGSRDLSRNVRMAHLQYIVKTLSSYSEMRTLRNKLPAMNMEHVEKKNALFVEAFATAYDLLFKESQFFPSIYESDADFDAYISANNLKIAPNNQDDLYEDVTLSTTDFPRRSLNPKSQSDARHCINFNIIMSILLNENYAERSFLNDPVLKTVGSDALAEGLDQLHRDGLVSKVRSADRQTSGDDADTTDPMKILKNQISCAIFYRHFFYHHFHNDLMSLIRHASTRFSADVVDETEFSDPGSLLLLASRITADEEDIDFTVPPSLESLFESTEEKAENSRAIKQLRYLENADLHIDLIKISPSTAQPLHVVVDFQKTITSLTHKVPVEELESAKLRDAEIALAFFEETDRPDAGIVYNAIESSGISGLSEEELVMVTSLEPLRLKVIIGLLMDSFDIFPCGIDTRRYVLMKNADCWMVCNNTVGFFPRPWSLPSGEVNVSLLKWMAEAILVLIHKKPGITIHELINCYSFVLQPIIVEEILCLLELIDCCHISIKSMRSMSKTPGGGRMQRVVRYALPVKNGLERFSDFFKDFIK